MLIRRYKPALMTKKVISIFVSVLISASSIGAAWAVVETGHNGAKASWCEVSKNCQVSTGTDMTDDDEG